MSDNIRMTAKQRVLQLLILARLDTKPFLLHEGRTMDEHVWISGGFRPVYWFTGKGKGGSAGYQLMNQLKNKNNVPVEMRRHHWEYWNSVEMKKVARSTPIYRLKMDIFDIEISNIREGLYCKSIENWWFDSNFKQDIDPLTNQIGMKLE